MPSRVASVALVCFVLGAARPAVASAVDPVAVYDAVAPAVGIVVTFDAQRYPVDSGPGFFVAEDDLFVTQLHMLAGATSASEQQKKEKKSINNDADDEDDDDDPDTEAHPCRQSLVSRPFI